MNRVGSLPAMRNPRPEQFITGRETVIEISAIPTEPTIVNDPCFFRKQSNYEASPRHRYRRRVSPGVPHQSGNLRAIARLARNKFGNSASRVQFNSSLRVICGIFRDVQAPEQIAGWIKNPVHEERYE